MSIPKQLDVIYVKMPITIDQKHEYNRQGFRVVDERFKPADAEEHVAEEDAAPKRRRKTKED